MGRLKTPNPLIDLPTTGANGLLAWSKRASIFALRKRERFHGSSDGDLVRCGWSHAMYFHDLVTSCEVWEDDMLEIPCRESDGRGL